MVMFPPKIFRHFFPQQTNSRSLKTLAIVLNSARGVRGVTWEQRVEYYNMREEFPKPRHTIGPGPRSAAYFTQCGAKIASKHKKDSQ